MPGANAIAAAIALAAGGGALALTGPHGATSAAPARVVAAARTAAENEVRPEKVSGYPGPALVCEALDRGCRPLTRTTGVAFRSFIDTRKGAVSLATRRADGRATRVTVRGAIFELRKATDVGGAPVVRLAAATSRPCAARTRERPDRPPSSARSWPTAAAGSG